jgi:ubiquinone/menaquinone biosynthesis C-methylase UbiE
LYLLAYGVSSPLYDWITWWGFLPMGGERACRKEFARWLRLETHSRVVSLCCGTGSTERALLENTHTISLTGIDLGRGQIARARRRLRDRPVTLVLGDAAHTGLATGGFDRVLIGLALHEMKRPARLAVLREAARLCAPAGRVLAIEHARPRTRGSRLARALWCFFWVPGNPEVATSNDLQQRGLDSEMRKCGLEIVERHTTRPDWVEGILARPAGGAGGPPSATNGS